MLELQSVTRLAGREAVLERASLAFSRTTPIAVLGLSHEARTGFLRLAAGLDQPASGSVKLDGREIRPQRKKAGRYAWINQTGAAPSSRTVARLIKEAGGRNLPTADASLLAQRVGLQGQLNARVRELAPAQRIRLAIACARAAKPDLILLDAPFSDLREPPPSSDPRAGLLADLPAMLEDTGAVVILAAGLPDEALALGGGVVILARGRVVQTGSAAEVFAHPKDLRALLATADPASNTFEASIEDGRCRLGDGSTFAPPPGLSLPLSGRCTFAFRPADLHFDRRSEEAARFAVRALGETSDRGRRYALLGFANASWLAPLETDAAALNVGLLLNAFVERRRLLVFDEAGMAMA